MNGVDQRLVGEAVALTHSWIRFRTFVENERRCHNKKVVVMSALVLLEED